MAEGRQMGKGSGAVSDDVPRHRMSHATSVVGVSRTTIRNWCASGLVGAGRTEGGQRLFSGREIQRMQEIRRLQGEGLSLLAIQRLLAKHSSNEMAESPLSRADILGQSSYAKTPDRQGLESSPFGTSSADREPFEGQLGTNLEADDSLAGEAAAVNARLYLRERELVRQLTSLQAVSDAILGSRSIGEMLQKSLECICERARADGGAVYLGDEGLLTLRASYGIEDEEALPRRLPRGTGIAGRAAEGRPILLPHLAQAPEDVRRSLSGAPVNSVAGIPIGSKDAVTGSLVLFTSKPGRFRMNELPLLQGMTDRLSVGIENASLRREVDRGEAFRRVAEERMRFLALLLESVTDGIIATDREGKIAYWNHGAESIFGYVPQEMMGTPLKSVLGNDLRVVDGTDPELLEQGELLAISDLRSKDDRPIWISVRITNVRDDLGQVSGSLAVVRDITQMKTLQERQLEHERLRALGEMASGLVHNFNNVFAQVLGYSEMLLNNSRSMPPAEGLSAIFQAAVEGAAMVARLERFVHSGRENMGENMETVDLSKLTGEVLEITKPRWKDQAEASGLTISIVNEQLDTPCVLGNADSLREVLTSLVMNALDAMPNGGILTIRSGKAGPNAVIEVADNGTGMSEEVRRRAFDPFFSTKWGRGRSLGLGLSLAREAIARQGGRIELESREGTGSCLRILLPIAEDAPTNPSIDQPANPDAVSQPAKLRPRLLVVEDDPGMRQLLAYALENEGCEVILCSSGEEALRRLSERTFDALLTDLGMPGMSGGDLIGSVKTTHPSLPVALVTGWAGQLGQRSALNMGADALLAKPFTRDEIRALLRQMHLSRE